jgi:biopolymer transport protein ExbD
MRLPRQEIKRARIEIVPMIDTMAFLLIFFMMASLAMTPMNSLKVNLPGAASGEQTNAARVILTMTIKGDIFLNRRKVSLNEVTPLLQDKIAANPETQVVINADKNLLHGQVITLFDAAHLAHPKYIQLATKPNPNFRE